MLLQLQDQTYERLVVGEGLSALQIESVAHNVGEGERRRGHVSTLALLLIVDLIAHKILCQGTDAGLAFGTLVLDLRGDHFDDRKVRFCFDQEFNVAKAYLHRQLVCVAELYDGLGSLDDLIFQDYQQRLVEQLPDCAHVLDDGAVGAFQSRIEKGDSFEKFPVRVTKV